jgi:defect-in-organelle-trafficking protein DotC
MLRIKPLFKHMLPLFATLLIASCTVSAPKPINTDNLSDIENLTSTSYGDSEKAISNIREEGLKETALTLGAQSGLAYRSKQINQSLEKKSTYLNNVFNFNPIMLEHSVVPPVLIQANNTLSISGPDSLRISDKTYRIAKQAEFVTTPPTWRTYLWMKFKTPELPNKTLLPRNPQEEQVWKKYIAIGWGKGEKQADRIFKVNLAQLKRDYQGMLLYRDLLAKHMISQPFVAKTDLGVTGDGNSININDQVLRITATPQLQTNSKEWQPVLVK